MPDNTNNSNLKYGWPFVRGMIRDGGRESRSAGTFLRFGEDIYWARFQINGVPDFCGGTSMNSPQVIHLRRNPWASDEQRLAFDKITEALPDMRSRGGIPWVTRTRATSRKAFRSKAFEAIAAEMIHLTLAWGKGAVCGAGPTDTDEGYDDEPWESRYGVHQVFAATHRLPRLRDLVLENRTYQPEHGAGCGRGPAFINPNTARTCAWYTWFADEPDSEWDGHCLYTTTNAPYGDELQVPREYTQGYENLVSTMESLFDDDTIGRMYSINQLWGVG